MTTITPSSLLNKLRRARRNNTGAGCTHEELGALAEMGVLHMLAKAEADEMLSEWRGRKDASPTAPGSPRTVDRAVYSVRTLAERWGCSHGLVRSMIARGELKSFRHGGHLIRITADAVAEVEARRE